MTASGAKMMVRVLAGAWPASGATADTWNTYTTSLSDLDDEVVLLAIDLCVQRHDSDRLPTVARIRAAASEILRERLRDALPALPEGPPSDRSLAAARLFSRRGRGEIGLPEFLREMARLFPLAPESVAMVEQAERLEQKGEGPLGAALRGAVR